MRCLTCESYRKTGCSFNNGDVRLRRAPDGSVKIVFQLAGQDAIVVRDISESNVGIREQRSSSGIGPDSRMQVTLQGRGVKRVVSSTSLKASEEKVTQEAGFNGPGPSKVESSDEGLTGSEYEGEEEEEQENYGGDMIDDEHAPWSNYKFTSDPEDEDFSEKRKRKRSSRSRYKGSSRQAKSTRISESQPSRPCGECALTSVSDDRASVRKSTQAFSRLPTPATSVSPGLPDMSGKTSASNGRQRLTSTNSQNGAARESSSEDETLADRKASRIRLNSALNQSNQVNRQVPLATIKKGASLLVNIEEELQESEKRNQLLKRIEQLTASIDALEQSQNPGGNKHGRSLKDLEATIQGLEKKEETHKRVAQLHAVNKELEQRLF